MQFVASGSHLPPALHNMPAPPHNPLFAQPEQAKSLEHFNQQVSTMIHSGDNAELQKSPFQKAWAFWILYMRFLAGFHGVIACAYDLAYNMRTYHYSGFMYAKLKVNNWMEEDVYEERHKDARKELLISLTNFGFGIYSTIGALVVDWPAQVRAYALELNPNAQFLPRAQERAAYLSWFWGTLYGVFIKNVMWAPNGQVGKEWEKHIGATNLKGGVVSGDDPEADIVPGTLLDPFADGQVESRWHMEGTLDARVWTPPDGSVPIKCKGGEYTVKLSKYMAHVEPFTTMGFFHKAAVEKTPWVGGDPHFHIRWQQILPWLRDGSEKPGYFNSPDCHYDGEEDISGNVRSYVRSQIARMKPPPKSEYIPKNEVANMVKQFFMLPTSHDMEADMMDVDNLPMAPAQRWPTAVVEGGYNAALNWPAGTTGTPSLPIPVAAFAAWNPISTNMVPEVTGGTGMVR